MNRYLAILEDIMDEGVLKGNRTGVKTVVLPNQHFSHNMADGFPLLTTKRVAHKTMATELEGFIKGVVSKKWYSDRGCKIWNEWANPIVVQHKTDQIFSHSDASTHEESDAEYAAIKKDMQAETDDLGPIYGYQWRNFNHVYDENDNGTIAIYDQFKTIVDTLKNNPNDRRMVCSAWNPIQIDRMALPPCHLCFILTHIEGVLSLHWTQRSCDMFLGVPFNIASYGLLLELFCKEANMTPGNLSGMLCDCHIYENHIPQVVDQLDRGARELPTLKINNWDGIFNWKATDIEFENYNPHPPIKAKVAV